MSLMSSSNVALRPELFLLVHLREIIFRFSVGQKKEKESYEHFQNFFFYLQKKTPVKLERLTNSLYSLNIYHLPKTLDRTITFNSATLKNTQTEPQKYIIFFRPKK